MCQLWRLLWYGSWYNSPLLCHEARSSFGELRSRRLTGDVFGTKKHSLTLLQVKHHKNFLESFTVFPKLLKEIRYMLWLHTLEPRVVEIEYSVKHGFYSRVNVPIAMRACPKSRQAVLQCYPLSFGNILHRPTVPFNVSLDTLCFDMICSDGSRNL